MACYKNEWRELSVLKADTMNITTEISPDKDYVEVHATEADKQQFPEGGKGWLVVFGCTCCSLMSFGMTNSYGVFQTHYETVLFSDVPSIKLSIIGASQASICYLVTSMTLPLIYAFGIRQVLLLGCSLMMVAMFGLSTTHQGQLWKCYLFQAVMFSIGMGLVFAAILFSPIEWFKRRRAMALGISMSGVAVGGIIWPIIFKNMIKHNSFNWTVRTIAFLYIPLSIGAVLLVPQELDPRFIHKAETVSNSRWSIEKIKDLPSTYRTSFKNWIRQTTDMRYDSMLLSNILGMFGSYPAIFYLDYFATLIAPNATFTNYTVTIYNLFGGPGRVLPGIIGDKIGRCNCLIAFLLVLSISIFTMWIPCIKYQILPLYAVFVCIFGLCVAPFYSLFPACFTQIFGTQGSEARLGLFLFTSFPGPLLGCVIAGSFIPKGTSSAETVIHAYYKLTIYSGVVMMACALVLLGVRLSITKRLLRFV